MPTHASDDYEPEDMPEDPAQVRTGRPFWKIVFFGLLALLVGVVAVGWFTRESIAENLISAELEKRGIPATYTVESIGTREQVLTNLVIGDPANPDFTASRAVVTIRLGFGVPGIVSLRLERARLYGRYLDGQLSFGSLDPLIFTGSDEPFRLPDIGLDIEDGRALLESEYGAVGIKLAGSGNLRSGFDGQIAATAPGLTFEDCRASDATVFGTISVSAEKPRFAGPVRLGRLRCEKAGLRLASAAMQTELIADAAMDGAEGRFALDSGAAVLGTSRMAGAEGTLRFAWRDGRLMARYDLEGRGLSTPQLGLPRLAIDGRIRGTDNLARIDIESDISGSLAGPGAGLVAEMDALVSQASGTFAGDLGKQLRSALIRETRGATFAGSFSARTSDEGQSLIVPQMTLRGAGGSALLSLSRLQLRAGQGGGESAVQVLSGNFTTGGAGLPRISGRIARGPRNALALNLTMPEYRAGTARLALPAMVLVQSPDGLGFTGEARLSGALPGGQADNVALPVEGKWSQSAGLSVWRRCIAVTFDRLELANLRLSKRALQVCPPRGGAIVRSGPGGLKVAAGLPSLDLAGQLGSTPIRIVSGPVGFAYPGNLEARTLDVALGPAQSASRFRLSRLSARLGQDIAGTFDDADVEIFAVPLDMRGVGGRWNYANGKLLLSDGELRLEDREPIDRFEPLIARGATLTLADNLITAQALLREPQSDREVVRALIRHNLASGRGDAELQVDNLVFDAAMQPDTLTHLALGVIANADGIVRGTGRIDWDENGVTSTGRFATEGLDFAAAFGPVKGASGTVEFTDLLGLVTAPDQTLQVKSINPGIEVNDGVLTFALEPDYVLAVDGAQWPFMGGTLRLRPARLRFGSDEAMRYELVIEGLDAARFVQRLELENLAATGIFDGWLPLVFDKDGGRIEGGMLQSRPPGGNVSYVGELTYEDLSPMANFAFDALRSIDYKDMSVGLEGALEGEIVTRVTFDGISQGQDATSNFITRRIARLPIRFRINVRAPFMQLMASVRSLYDREYIRDPRTLGIVGEDGIPAAPFPRPETSESPGPAPVPGKPSVQPSESDPMP